MTKKFDPRFDLRFQPGYDGELDVGSVGAEREAIPPHSSRVESTDDGESVIDEQLVDGTHSARDEFEQSLIEQSPLEQGSFEQNPFERALGVVAAVFIVGGVASMLWANSQMTYNYGAASAWTWQQILQSAAWALSSPMITVGLATGVGLLFRRAITWTPPE